MIRQCDISIGTKQNRGPRNKPSHIQEFDLRQTRLCRSVVLGQLVIHMEKSEIRSPHLHNTQKSTPDGIKA